MMVGWPSILMGRWNLCHDAGGTKSPEIQRISRRDTERCRIRYHLTRPDDMRQRFGVRGLVDLHPLRRLVEPVRRSKLMGGGPFLTKPVKLAARGVEGALLGFRKFEYQRTVIRTEGLIEQFCCRKAQFAMQAGITNDRSPEQPEIINMPPDGFRREFARGEMRYKRGQFGEKSLPKRNVLAQPGPRVRPLCHLGVPLFGDFSARMARRFLRSRPRRRSSRGARLLFPFHSWRIDQSMRRIKLWSRRRPVSFHSKARATPRPAWHFCKSSG